MAAPPTLSGCHLNELGDRYAHVVCSISSANVLFDFRVSWDTDNTSLDNVQQRDGGPWSASLIRNEQLSTLPPDSDIYIGVEVSDTDGTTWSGIPTCSTTCTNCNSTDNPIFANNSPVAPGGSGFDCDGIGDYWKFHTAELFDCGGNGVGPGNGAPCKPLASPSHSGATSPPTVTGSTRTVDAGCTNLQAHLDSAAAAARSGSTVEEIIIPPDRICRPENEGGADHYDLPRACPGRVVLRSGADAKLLPPPGTQIDPTFLPHTGKIEWNLNPSKRGNTMLRFETISNEVGCWYLENISVSTPPLDELTPIILNITNINTSTDVLTASSAVPSTLVNGDRVLVNLEGTGVRNGHGYQVICDISGATFTLDTGSCTGARQDLLGTYTSGGSVGRWVALAVESVSNTTPVALTITGHGMGNYPPMTITGGSGATVTVSGAPAEYGIVLADPVRVQGTGNGSCDGIREATAIAGSVITLSGASCGGVSGGTVRYIEAISMFNSSDDDLGAYEPRVWYPEILDANTIALLNSTAQGTVATPGWITGEAPMIIAAVGQYDDPPRLHDVTLDRLLVQAPFPWRMFVGITLGVMDKVVLQNSWIHAEKWQRVDPVTNDPIGNSAGYGSFVFTGSHDLQILNNMFYRNYNLFCDFSNSGCADITIHGNTFYRPDTVVNRYFIPSNPNPASNGHYYHHGFGMELKSCDTCKITGNYMRGSSAGFNPSGPAIALAGQGAGNDVDDTVGEDVEIAYNWIDSSAAGIMITANDGGAASRRRVTKRIYIHDNLVTNISTMYDVISQTGPFLFLWDKTVDVIVERNTYHVRGARKPLALEFAGKGQGHVNRNGLYIATGGNTMMGGGVAILGGSQGKTAFDTMLVRGTTPDPLSSFSGHVIVPGIENSSSGDPVAKAASTNTSDTVCVHEVLAASVFSGLTSGLTFVGNTNNPCNESFNTRLNLAFAPASFASGSSYSNKGADIEQVRDQQNKYREATVTAGSTQATIAWTAPNTDACTVDLTHTTLDFSVASNITRSTYSGSPSKSQSVVFGGLTPGTQYAYRISCKQPPLRGELTTDN